MARLRRIGWWLLAAFLVMFALGYLGESTRTLILPNTGIGGGGLLVSHLPTKAARGNGLFFCAGLSLLWLALRAANAATRRAGEEQGAVDRFLAHPTRALRWLALALGACCLGVFAWLFAFHLFVHASPEAAASIFHEDVDALSIQVNGDYVYGLSHDESKLHVATFTPALVRAFRAADVPIGETVPEVDFPVPGWSPLLVLIGAAVLWSLRPAWRPRLLVVATLACSYVVLWLLSADSMVTIFDAFTVNPDWFGAALLIAGTGLSQLGVLHRNKYWFAPYCLGVLVTLAWSYRFSGAMVFGLSLFWQLAFAGLLCVFWWRTLMRTPA